MSTILGKVQLRASPPHAKPSAFSWVPFDVHVIRPNGTVAVGFDLAPLAPAGKRYYVSPGGSNANDGLTPATPKETLRHVFNRGDGVEIILMDGIHRRAWEGDNPPVSCSIKAFPGARPIISAHDNLTWGAVGASHPNVYQATRSGVGQVYDAKYVDESGDYLRLAAVGSLDDVNDTPGSWFQSGSTVYVRAHDDRAPDNDIRAYLRVNSGNAVGDITVYLEGIAFEGGNSAFVAVANGSDVPKVYAKNCTFKYSTSPSGNCFSSRGAITYLQDCEAVGGIRDGFNYHAEGSAIPQAVEINCVGRNNGMPEDANNSYNGSTGHDGALIARFNGVYTHNKGPNIADVSGCKSWNVCCESGPTAADLGVGATEAGIYAADEMWLDTCRAWGSPNDLMAAGSSGRIRVRNTDWGTQTTSSGGTIEVWAG